jgi:hypothetical protein
MLDPAKQVEILQSTRWWAALTIAGTAAAFIFIPFLAALLPPGVAWIAWILLILFALLFVFQSINAAFTWFRKRRPALEPAPLPHAQKPRRYHITEIGAQSWWAESKQADGKWAFQMSSAVVIKNLTDKPLHLLKAKIVEPKIAGFVINDAIFSDHSVIPPGSSERVPIHIFMLRKGQYQSGHIEAVIAVQDDEGHEETAKITIRDQKSSLV